jgi:hypothetical protein
MFNQSRIWRVIVPVVLIAVVMATSFGMAWHDHDHCSSVQCALCHLVTAPPIAAALVHAPVFTGAGPVPQSNQTVARLIARQVPARAPPA